MTGTDSTPHRHTTPTGLSAEAIRDISAALNAILADSFALYLKTRSFQWHMTGAHSRDYQLLLGEQSAQLLALTDRLAPRVRRIGGSTVRSIGHVARLQRIIDNDSDSMSPAMMLAELHDDNRQFAKSICAAHHLCEERGDVASAGLLNQWIDEAEGRAWLLNETMGRTEGAG